MDIDSWPAMLTEWGRVKFQGEKFCLAEQLETVARWESAAAASRRDGACRQVKLTFTAFMECRNSLKTRKAAGCDLVPVEVFAMLDMTTCYAIFSAFCNRLEGSCTERVEAWHTNTAMGI